MGSSRVLILNSTIVFLKSVPKTPFRSKFDPQTQKYFVLNGIRYKWQLKGADSEFNNAFLKTNHETTFKSKVGPEIQKCFVLNGTPCKGEFNCADFKFNHFS